MTLRVEVPGEKIVNVEPCKCNKSYGTEIAKAETKFSRRLKQFIKKSWDFRSKITVEPFVICYVLPSMLAGLAVQNLCLEKSCLVNLQYDERTCHHIMQGRTHNYTEQEKNVQIMVTGMTAWSFPLQTALPGLLTLFLGAWSDRTGNRKAFMVLPILGKLISIFGIILSTVFFLQIGLNETALIEGLPPALAGGRVAMTMAVYSYITDITSATERTFRLGIITAILTLTRPVGLALSGYMTRRLSYYGVFSVACAFYLTGFVYIIVRLKEKTKKTIDGDKSLIVMFSPKDLVATVNVAFKSRAGYRRLQIILCMFAYMFIVGPVLGEAQMTYWFTRYKFKFTEVDYSLFLTYSALVGSVGSFVTIYLFSKRWKIEDSVIGVVACFSRIAAAVVYALAPDRTIYFLGPVLDMFSSAGATSLRSIATKLVHADEIGKTSSLISISEALVPVIYSPVYSKVYLSTLSTFAGAFYLISAALAVPAIGILITLIALNRRDAAEPAPPPAEVKPKENEITRF
ncbi:proton-coupled folate transporter-like isoform X1 [Ostrinia nubilalis]|uniref:proton-coupled folate transporter-like isoform X1 n=1 Tax=Ostrinia furnacalis TaxID=93504 RepID=UPI00103F3022|nr:proton-coupled folate transporter-like isoform X1 [Ostrinia furnacalis]XP_028169921.1 proton-coupled folate transporter-like isoform X2 [Ostrinia furnacalis]